MQIYELQAALKYQYYAHKDDWEQARLISWLIAQTNSTKRIKPTDIIKFDWEEDSKPHIKTISNQQIQRLRKKAQKYIKNG